MATRSTRLSQPWRSSRARERQAGKLHTARSLARRALDEVRPDLDLDQAEELLLNDRRRAKIDLALERHAKLTALEEQTEKAARDSDGRARDLLGALRALVLRRSAA